MSDFDFERRFGGLARLYGKQGATNIFSAHVVVVGIGGVGSWAAEALARSGVSHISLIDMDHIAESNINRQVHALDTTLGIAKVQAMRARILDINPQCVVTNIDDFVTPENWTSHLKALTSLTSNHELAVIDACDQNSAKTAMAAHALANTYSHVTVGAAGGKQLAHLVSCGDLSLVTHDPLLSKLRYQLRRHHHAARRGKIGVTCVYSKEAVLRPEPIADVCETTAFNAVTAASDLNCHGYGSSVSVTATFGLAAAGYLLNQLAYPSKRQL